MPPSYVKPYVKRQKNDTADAAGICELGRELEGVGKEERMAPTITELWTEMTWEGAFNPNGRLRRVSHSDSSSSRTISVRVPKEVHWRMRFDAQRARRSVGCAYGSAIEAFLEQHLQEWPYLFAVPSDARRVRLELEADLLILVRRAAEVRQISVSSLVLTAMLSHLHRAGHRAGGRPTASERRKGS